MKSNLDSTTEKTYLSVAIFITIFIFFPTGIFAVKHSLEAKQFYKSKRFSEARTAANISRKIIIITSIVVGAIYASGLLGGLVYLILKH